MRTSASAKGEFDSMPSLQTWLKLVLLPPTNLFLASLFGLLAPSRWRMRIVATSVVILVFLSMPVIPYGLAILFATAQPYYLTSRPQEQAIVVLGGGIVTFAAEYDRPDVALDSLQRLRFAAYLHIATGLPIVVTGYVPVPGSSRTLTDLMTDTLEHEFHVPVRWREQRSRNTLENAAYTAELLRPLGITRVIVVTDSIHMPRALWSFRRAGLEPTAAPIALPGGPLEAIDLLPRIDGLVASYNLAYEVFGLAWYHVADKLGLIAEQPHR
jgi:uncharacterized SAM-binding protein YcdF (DUF218 family)